MDSEYTHNFSSGLCDCCAEEDGCSTCCLTYFLPCIQFGTNVERIEPKYGAWCGGDYTAACGGFCGALLVGQLMSTAVTWALGIPSCVPFYILPMMNARRAIRKKYQIRGNGLGDCCTVLWCASCAICQEHRQLKLPARDEPASGIPIPTLPPRPMVVTKGDYMALPVSEELTLPASEEHAKCHA